MYVSMVTGGVIGPNRMMALNTSEPTRCAPFAVMRKARLFISGAHVQKCVPLPREHAPIFSQARVAWDFDEADTSLSWSLGIPSVLHPSVLVPGAQEVADWEAKDDTCLGHHRQGQIEIAGPYFLDGSASVPEIVVLRRAEWGVAV